MKSKNKIIIIILLVLATICIGTALFITIFVYKDNGEEKITSEAKNALNATLTVKYEIGNAKSIGSSSSKCYASGSSCFVITPSIEAPVGYEVAGWSLSENLDDVKYEVGQKLEVSKDIILYAVVKEEKELNKDLQVGSICNKNLKCIVGIDMVDAACTQVGYVEKATDSNTDDCTLNPGINNYQKFGNSGNVWDSTFINWSATVASINLGNYGIDDLDDVSSYMEWAKNNNRLYTNRSSLKNGDLVLINDNSHIGIAVNIDDVWYMISGNYDNQVKMVILDNVSNYISMKGIAY